MNNILLLAFLCGSASAFGADLAVGVPAPELTARMLDRAATMRLSSNLGKVTIGNFWATWCAPCRWQQRSLPCWINDDQNS